VFNHLLLEHQHIAQAAERVELMVQLYLAVLAVAEFQPMITTEETEQQTLAVVLVVQELLALLLAVTAVQVL
jgi:hypothetical protein